MLPLSRIVQLDRLKESYWQNMDAESDLHQTFTWVESKI